MVTHVLRSKRPLRKRGATLTNEMGEWGSQESCEPTSLGPRTLLFAPPPSGLLLRSDRRHLKNNFMHGCCHPPPLFLYCSSILFLSPLGLYHPRLCREEWGMEDGKEAEGSQGVREERGWAGDWNVKLKQKQHQRNTVHTDEQDYWTCNRLILTFSTYWITLYRTIVKMVIW